MTIWNSAHRSPSPPAGVTGHLVQDLNTREGCIPSPLCASTPEILGKYLNCQLVQSASESFSCSQSSADWHVAGSRTVTNSALAHYQNYICLLYFLWILKSHDQMTLNIRSSQDWQLWKQSPSYLKYRAITYMHPQTPRQHLQKMQWVGFSDTQEVHIHTAGASCSNL